MGSIIDNAGNSTANHQKTSPCSSIKSADTSMSSLKSISNPDYFTSMLNDGMTEKEIRDRASTFYQHQVNKAQLAHQRALETYLASKPVQSAPVVTPHKSKLSGSVNAGDES
jgi:hypothetical protein